MLRTALTLACMVMTLEVALGRQGATVDRVAAARCVNNGEHCRCSKQQDLDTGIALCARPQSSQHTPLTNAATMSKASCTLHLCDMPFRCDCRGAYLCAMRTSTDQWTCDDAASRANKARRRKADSCACSRRRRKATSYGLRVTGQYDYKREPSSICDWDTSFWA